MGYGSAGVQQAGGGSAGGEVIRMLRARSRAQQLARLAAYFAKLWSAVAIEPPLWEGGGRRPSRRPSKHHTLRVVTIPPPSQSGGLATALQSASHEMAPTGATPSSRFPCCVTMSGP